MKKLCLLTSLFALAACGGGGSSSNSHGSFSGGNSNLPERAAVNSAEVLNSNSNVTSMASEILIPNDNSGAVLHRAGTVHENGKTYTSYRLDDVNFRVATGANDAYLKFNMDDTGKIDSLVMDTGNTVGVQHMDRYGDTNKFRGIVYEYIVTNAAPGATGDAIALAGDEETLVRMVFSPSDDVNDYSVLNNAASGKCPENKVCRWDRIDQAFQVNAQGTGFKYSDFGKLQTTNFGKYKGILSQDELNESKEHTRTKNAGVLTLGTYKTWADSITFDDDNFYAFAGGYDVDAIQYRPTTTTTFSGTAIGSLYATDDEDHPDKNVALIDNSATLVFDTATQKETLAMSFDNWYDVTVEKNNSNGTNKITFDNYTNTSGDAEYLKFRQDSGTGLEKNNFTTTTGSYETDGGVKTQGLLQMGYYGLNAPEEATGIVRFKEYSNEGGTIQEREFRAGYGMTPNP